MLIRLLERIKKWFRQHKKAVVITATIVAITGAVVTLIVNGEKVTMTIDELTKKLLPEASKRTKPSEAISASIPKPMTKADLPSELVSVPIDGEVKIINRSEFIRHLHEGWNASEAKIAEAAQKGIDLQPGETIVNGCTVKLKAS